MSSMEILMWKAKFISNLQIGIPVPKGKETLLLLGSVQLLQPSLFKKIRKQVQASHPKFTESLLLTQMRVFPSSGWELMRKTLEGATH